MALKTCTGCKRSLPKSEFHKHPQGSGGLDPRCKHCASARKKRYRKSTTVKEREKARNRAYRKANPDKQKRYKSRSYNKNRAAALCTSARRRAQLKRVPFALEVADIQRRLAVGYCELTGIKFDLTSRRSPFSPSLDRRTPAKGYTTENVRVICWGLNVALHTWGEEPLLKILCAWQRKLGVFA